MTIKGNMLYESLNLSPRGAGKSPRGSLKHPGTKYGLKLKIYKNRKFHEIWSRARPAISSHRGMIWSSRVQHLNRQDLLYTGKIWKVKTTFQILRILRFSEANSHICHLICSLATSRREIPYYSYSITIKVICSTSLPGGNQVDGLPPASSITFMVML